MTAIVFACLVDMGLLDYNERVSTYWPEFAQYGKENVKVADVLRHEAGLAYIHHTWDDDLFSPENLKKNLVGQAIETAEQRFPDKSLETDREYHGLTRGLILNEIFRRVEPHGRTIGEFLREEISEPLGTGVMIGATKEEAEKMKKLTSTSVGTVLLHSLLPKFVSQKIEVSLWGLVKSINGMIRMMKDREGEPKRIQMLKSWTESFGPATMGEKMDADAMKHGELPSYNGAASARGLAKLGACMINGGSFQETKIMSQETVQKLMAEPTAKIDAAMPQTLVTNMTQGGVGYFM